MLAFYNFLVFFAVLGITKPLTAQQQFSELTITFNVSESSPPGSDLGDIFSASQGVVRPPLIFLENPPASFDLDLSSGSLTLLEHLDREQVPSYSFLIFYGEEGNLARVFINVLDENDNAPRFDSSTWAINISELTPVPKCWQLPSPKDADEARNSVTSCILLSRQQHFRVDFDSTSQHLDLCLLEPLDFEQAPYHQLTIRALDGGAKFADLTVDINILDENDNSPQFELPRYEVSSEFNGQSKILQVKAFDKDSSDNGRVSYALKSSEELLPFTIEPNEGWIAFSGSEDLLLDTRQFSFVVRAFDGGKPSLESEVPVFIRLTRKASSTVKPDVLHFWIDRDAPPGSFVGLLPGVVDDFNQSSSSQFFSLHRSSGVLALSRWLPCDLTSQREGMHFRLAHHHHHQLTNLHRHQEQQKRSSNYKNYYDLTISVRTQHEQSSATTSSQCLAFQRPLYHLTASAERDYCFGRVVAVSSDRCSTIRYSLVKTNSIDGELFRVDPLSGQICWSQRGENILKRKNYVFQISATNGQFKMDMNRELYDVNFSGVRTAYSVVRVEIPSAAEEMSGNDFEFNITLNPMMLAKSGGLIRDAFREHFQEISEILGETDFGAVVVDEISPVSLAFRSSKKYRFLRINLQQACLSTKTTKFGQFSLNLGEISSFIGKSSILSNKLEEKRDFVYSLNEECRKFLTINHENAELYANQPIYNNLDCSVEAFSPSLLANFTWAHFQLSANLTGRRLVLNLPENAVPGYVLGKIPFKISTQIASDYFRINVETNELVLTKKLDLNFRELILSDELEVSVENDRKLATPQCLLPNGFSRDIFVPSEMPASFYLGRIRAFLPESINTRLNFSLSRDDHPFIKVDNETGDAFLTGQILTGMVQHFTGLRKLLIRVKVSSGLGKSIDCFVKVSFHRNSSSVLPSKILKMGRNFELPFLEDDISIISQFDGPLCNYLNLVKTSGSYRLEAGDIKLSAKLFDRLNCAFYGQTSKTIVPFWVEIDRSEDENMLPRTIRFETLARFDKSKVVLGRMEDYLGNGGEVVEIKFCSVDGFLTLENDRNFYANWISYTNAVPQIHCLLLVSKRLVHVVISISGQNHQTSNLEQPETPTAPIFITPLPSYLNSRISSTIISPGLAVCSAIAYSLSSDGSIEYSLENDYDGIFAIDARTGLVTFQRVPTFNPGSSVHFRLTLIAKSNGLVSSSDFEFSVDWPARDESGSAAASTHVFDFSALENSLPGTILGRLAVERLFPTISNPASIQASFIGDFDFQNAPVNLPQYPSWTLTTAYQFSNRAWRFGSRLAIPMELKSPENDERALALVRILVKPSSRMAPQFQERTFHISVHENVKYDHLFQAIAYQEGDEEQSATLAYSFSNNVSSLFDGLLSIDRSTGLISSGTFDREQASLYNVTIYAVNADTKQAGQMQLVVLVLDANDNAPTVPKTRYSISLSGRERVSDKIFQLVAQDADVALANSQARLVFTLENGFGLFQLDSSSGDLTLVALPGVMPRQWLLRVNISDSAHSTPVEVHVNLETDANFPEGHRNKVQPFAMPHQKAFILENQPRGAAVASFGRWDGIKFYVKSGNSDKAFTLENDGVLRTRTMLDAEIRSLYNLEILALNESTNLELSSSEISVVVLDLNDNEPSLATMALNENFTKPDQEEDSFVILTLAKPGSRLGTLIASDPDSSSVLSFKVSENDFITVNPISGDVFLMKKFSDSFAVDFTASDGENRPNVRKMTFKAQQPSLNKISEGFPSSSTALKQLGDRSVFWAEANSCSEGSVVLSLETSEPLEYSIFGSNLFGINSIGKISFRKSAPPNTLISNSVDLIISARRNSTSTQFPLFLFAQISGVRKCSSQPSISSSSVSSLELPRSDFASLKPGSILTKLDVNSQTNAPTLFRVQVSPGQFSSFFGIDSDSHLRLLRPIASNFDAQIRVMALDPLSQQRPNQAHLIRLRVFGEKSPQTKNINLNFYEFSVSGKGPLDLLNVSGSARLDRFEGGFSFSDGRVQLENIESDGFAFIKSQNLLILTRKTFEKQTSLVKLTDVEEGSHLPTGELADCETECVYARKTAVGKVPELIRVSDADEFSFGFEGQREFSFEISEGQTSPLIGCLTPLDFDGAEAGLWSMEPLAEPLPEFLRFSPVEGCLYLAPGRLASARDVSFEVGLRNGLAALQKVQVSVRFQGLGRIKVESTTSATWNVPEASIDFGEAPEQIPGSTSTSTQQFYFTLSIAIPLAILLVFMLILLSVMLRRRWLNLLKLGKSGPHSTATDDEDSDGWIYRIASVFGSKQTKTVGIGRTNSFNTIGFTSVKYEQRPPGTLHNSSSTSSGLRVDAHRSSLCLLNANNLQGQNYQDLGQVQPQMRQSLFGLHVTPSALHPHHPQMTTAVQGHNNTGASSVSSGVEVSSNSGTSSTSPPPHSSNFLATVSHSSGASSATHSPPGTGNFYPPPVQVHHTSSASSMRLKQQQQQSQYSNGNFTTVALPSSGNVLYSKCTRAPANLHLRTIEIGPNDYPGDEDEEIHSQYV